MPDLHAKKVRRSRLNSCLVLQKQLQVLRRPVLTLFLLSLEKKETVVHAENVSSNETSLSIGSLEGLGRSEEGPGRSEAISSNKSRTPFGPDTTRHDASRCQGLGLAGLQAQAWEVRRAPGEHRRAHGQISVPFCLRPPTNTFVDHLSNLLSSPLTWLTEQLALPPNRIPPNHLKHI